MEGFMHFFLTLLCASLFLISCSGQGPSKAKFKVTFASAQTSAFAGLVVYGSSGTNKFVRVISNVAGSVSGTLQEELPQGSWKFGAIGWLGATPFSGQVSCAFTVTSLTGDAATVNLTLTNQRCFDTDVTLGGTFTNSTPHASYPFISSFCEGDVTGKSNIPCGYTPMTSPTTRGFASSYKLIVPGFRTFPSKVTTGEILESKCYRVGTDSEPVASPTYSVSSDGLNIPAFLASVEAPIQVQSFLSDDCSPAKGMLVRSLSAPAEAKIYWYSPGQNLFHVSASLSAICAKSDELGTSDFAAGAGTTSNPWIICSASQLLYLQKNYSSPSIKQANYVLGRDINLLNYVKTGARSTPSDSCLKLGNTFVPIGKQFDGSCNISDISPASTFVFDGNGKTISYFRFKSETDKAGFFNELYGKVYNLNLSRSEIEGKNYTGVIAGSATGATIQNVKVTDSRVEGDDKSGGILGFGQGSTMLTKVVVDRVKLRGQGNLGGIVGALTTGSVSEARFNGNIDSDYDSSYIGGIIGNSGGSISQVVSAGTILANSTYVGGIAGLAGNISYSRSDAYVFNRRSASNQFTGGIAGSVGSIDRSFFRGVVESNCTISCGIGALAGNVPGTNTNTFTVSNFSDGGSVGSNSYSLLTMSTDDNFLPAICNGAAPCYWLKTAGSNDFPRLAIESGHVCSLATNNDPVPTQIAAGRGSNANPIVLCSSAQFASVSSYSGKSFVMKQGIPLQNWQRTMNFSGVLDGEGNSLFGFSSSYLGNYESLWNQIQTGATVKNLILAGIRIKETAGCSGCHKAILAQSNYGAISNVQAMETSIEYTDTTIKAGTLAVFNYGQISGARVNGSLKGKNLLGGIASVNSGTIELSSFEGNIDLQATISAQVGGIAAMNSGTVRKNQFRGKFGNLVASSNRIGGIVGFHTFTGPSAPVVIDNDVNPEAEFNLITGVTYAGGIVGYSDNASNIISRNLFKGFIFNPGLGSTVKPLVGGGNFTNIINGNVNGNFASGTDFQILDATIVPNLSTMHIAPNCIMTIYGTPDDPTVTNGALYVNNWKIFQGSMTRISAGTYELDVPMSLGDCTSLNGASGSSLVLYKSVTTPVFPTLAMLKANYFNIIDITDSAEQDVAFTAYKEYLQGLPLSSPPTWTYEPDEDDVYRLFLGK